MVARAIEPVLIRLARQYPVVTLTGPRQSGKTTLCRMAFPGAAYVSLETPEDRRFAERDPRGFLAQFTTMAILDEVQRVPDLLSYIQTMVDERPQAGQYILTGSMQFELMGHVSQSLAGRTALLKLLPFSYEEAYGERKGPTLDEMLWTGFYPRIHDRKLNAAEALSFYVETYLERDVRALLNVQDLSQFERFVQLCAGRTAQVVNLSSLGNDCGVTHNTARSWLSVLEASYIIAFLRPHHPSVSKRLTKAPKMHFLDTGLAANLLGIETPHQLSRHPLRGALFETFVVGELLKSRFNAGQRNNLFYYRDQSGQEVDVVCEHGGVGIPIEVKSGQTICDDFFYGIAYYRKLNPKTEPMSVLVYGGDKDTVMHGTHVVGYRSLGHFCRKKLNADVALPQP